jgi:hypothetical protein
MNEDLRADFKALGYSESDLDKIAWQNQEAPSVTGNDLSLLVSTPKPGWSWILWLLGIALVFGVFEISITRKLKKTYHAIKDE